MPGLDAFFIKGDTSSTPYHVGKLKELPAETFAMLYSEEMDLFMRNHGKAVNCYSCSSPIEAPTNLVRYFEKDFHNACFLEEYNNDIFDLSIRDKEYYGLVRNAIVSKV
ncbi:MAG: hypothetical protein AABX93_00290 [Nanoarchaeota archaeon]